MDYYLIMFAAGSLLGYSIGCLVGIGLGRMQGRNKAMRALTGEPTP